MESRLLLAALAAAVAQAQNVPATTDAAAGTTTAPPLPPPATTLSTTLSATARASTSGGGNATTTATATSSASAAASASASPAAAERVECVSLAGSANCPSYAAFRFNAYSLAILQQTGVADRSIATVKDFDNLIDKYAHAGPRTVLDMAGCQTWDASYVRYAEQFHCDYMLQNQYVVANCNPAGIVYPRVSNTTCMAFYESMFDYISDPDLCVGTTKTGRQQASSEVLNHCNRVKDVVASGAGFEIDMALDTSSEHLVCGFGEFQGNHTESLISAFDYCSGTVDKCCSQDPELKTALDVGHLPEPVIPDIYNCQVKFNRFFLVSCGQLLGTIFGTLMGFVSIGVIWWGVQRQDKEAMKNTISGKSKEETKWMWQWFNNSALANPAKHDPSENASMGGPRLGERSSGGSNKSGSGQPSVFAKERREFQQFDDTGSPIPPEPVAAAAAAGFTQQQYNSHSRRSHPRRERRGSSANDNPHMKSRSQSRSPIRHQSPHRADHYQQETQGVDPFAEMMGGGPPVTMDSAVPAYHAVFEFYGVAGSPDLEHVRVGDRLVVLEVKPNGFGVARNLNTGKQGLVPMNILSR